MFVPSVEAFNPALLTGWWKPHGKIPLPTQDGYGLRFKNAKTSQMVILSTEDRGAAGMWLHLSTSFPSRIPTWDEVVAVKELFMGKDTKAMQMIPPREHWLNVHPFCLHVWVRLDGDAYLEEI